MHAVTVVPRSGRLTAILGRPSGAVQRMPHFALDKVHYDLQVPEPLHYSQETNDRIFHQRPIQQPGWIASMPPDEMVTI